MSVHGYLLGLGAGRALDPPPPLLHARQHRLTDVAQRHPCTRCTHVIYPWARGAHSCRPARCSYATGAPMRRGAHRCSQSTYLKAAEKSAPRPRALDRIQSREITFRLFVCACVSLRIEQMFYYLASINPFRCERRARSALERYKLSGLADFQLVSFFL